MKRVCNRSRIARATCQEVASALVLVVAVLIDPEAPQTRRLPCCADTNPYVRRTNARGRLLQSRRSRPRPKTAHARLGRDPLADGRGDSPRFIFGPRLLVRSESRWPGPSHTVGRLSGVLERPSSASTDRLDGRLASIARSRRGLPLRAGCRLPRFCSFAPLSTREASLAGQGPSACAHRVHDCGLPPVPRARSWAVADSWDRGGGGVSFPLRHYNLPTARPRSSTPCRPWPRGKLWRDLAFCDPKRGGRGILQDEATRAPLLRVERIPRRCAGGVGKASGWRRWRRKTSSWSADRCDVSDSTPAAADDRRSAGLRSRAAKLDGWRRQRARVSAPDRVRVAAGMRGTAPAVMRLRTKSITNLVDPARCPTRLRMEPGAFWTMCSRNSIGLRSVFVLFESRIVDAEIARSGHSGGHRLRRDCGRARDLLRGSQARPGRQAFGKSNDERSSSFTGRSGG